MTNIFMLQILGRPAIRFVQNSSCIRNAFVYQTKTQNLKQLGTLNASTQQTRSCSSGSSQKTTTTTTTTQNNASNNDEAWKPVYHLQIIPIAAALSRLKTYQAAVLCGGTPLCFALEQSAQLSPGTALTFLACGFSGLGTLSIASLLIQNLVGFIYINEEETRVKLAYIDFWGRRQHYFADVDDIIPASGDTEKRSFLDFHRYIRFQSDGKQKLKLLHKFGTIKDANTFAYLFN